VLKDRVLDYLAGKLSTFLLSRVAPVKQKEKDAPNNNYDDNCEGDETISRSFSLPRPIHQ
jgi:hypothetical protein